MKTNPAWFLLLMAALVHATDDVAIDGDLTDWQDEVSAPDDSCTDYSGQQEARGAAVATNFATVQPADMAYFRFDFDVVGLSGANTGDGCWLVDSDANGNVDAALCFSMTGSPLTLTAARFFSCDDNRSDTCGTATEQLSSAVQCAVTQTTDERLMVCPSDTEDTAVECSIPLAELAYNEGTVALIRACTSTSAQPNSSTFDCVFDATRGDAPWTLEPELGGGGTPVDLEFFAID